MKKKEFEERALFLALKVLFFLTMLGCVIGQQYYYGTEYSKNQEKLRECLFKLDECIEASER